MGRREEEPSAEALARLHAWLATSQVPALDEVTRRRLVRTALLEVDNATGLGEQSTTPTADRATDPAGGRWRGVAGRVAAVAAAVAVLAVGGGVVAERFADPGPTLGSGDPLAEVWLGDLGPVTPGGLTGGLRQLPPRDAQAERPAAAATCVARVAAGRQVSAVATVMLAGEPAVATELPATPEDSGVAVVTDTDCQVLLEVALDP